MAENYENYNEAVAKDLNMIKTILRQNRVSPDTLLNDVFSFYNTEEKRLVGIFESGYTVADLLNMDPQQYDADDIDQTFMVGNIQRLHDLVTGGEKVFFKGPEDIGYTAMTPRGLDKVKVDGMELLRSQLDAYSGLYHAMEDILGLDMPEYVEPAKDMAEDAESAKDMVQDIEPAKADLSSAEVISRLVRQDEAGKWVPVFPDASKFTSLLQGDRLQAMKDLQKELDDGNVHIRETDGSYSELKQTANGVLYRGELNTNEIKAAYLQDPKNQAPHGTLAMFFMRLIKGMGFHAFDRQIAEQEAYESTFENKLKERFLDPVLMRQTDIQVILNQDAAAAAREKDYKKMVDTTGLPKQWYAPYAIQDALMDSEKGVGKEIADRYNNPDLPGDPDNITLCFIAGVFGRPYANEEERQMQLELLGAIANKKSIVNDPKYAEYLKEGEKTFRDAYDKMMASDKNVYDPKPMRDLLHNTLYNFSSLLGNCVPLDKRAIAIGEITESIAGYIKSYTDLHEKKADKDQSNARESVSKVVAGIMNMKKLVQDGLKAQINLANPKRSAALAKRDAGFLENNMGAYLAYRTAEQMVMLNAAQNQQMASLVDYDPYNPGMCMQFLQNHSCGELQQYCIDSSYVQEITKNAREINGSNTVEQIHETAKRCSDVAYDGFRNGNISEIAQVAKNTIKAGAVLYDASKKNGKESEVSVEEMAVYKGNPKAPVGPNM